MDVEQVLCMNQGDGETSYAKVSYIQKQALLVSKSIKEKAIQEFYKMQENTSLKCLWIADFGCSSVELNERSAVYELIAIVEKTCERMGQNPPLEYQIALNDLPNNDFNTVFKSLSSFENLLKDHMRDNKLGHCFVGAFPGSFYGRLFPSNTLHIVHSSFSLHWLSQVPSGIDENNKENIVIGRTSSPEVIKAYADQFQNDFTLFLRCRSQEMVLQGVMALTLMGRQDKESDDKKSFHVYQLLASVLNDMVNEVS